MQAIAIAIATCGALCSSVAIARKQPVQLSATVDERPSTVAGRAAPGCSITLAGIDDSRQDPRVAGVIERRAVLAPADMRQWVTSAMGGLGRRGFPVADAAVSPPGPALRVTLQTAWVTEVTGSYSANIVVRVRAERGSVVLDKAYRGRAVRTGYWMGGGGSIQSAIDGAWTDLLDELAVDLRPLCANRPAGQPSS